jgi:CRISPR system Cascade subunit CasC
MLIQIHLLQNYAPANLNRDDTGSPKDAMFGGYRRGRISSQCLKRSLRKSAAFAEAFEQAGLLGVRTKKLYDLLRAELVAMSVDDDTLHSILARVSEIGRESSKRAAVEEEAEGEAAETEIEAEVETKQLIFLGKSELRPMAEKLLALYKEHGAKKWADPKKLKIADITKALGKSLPRSVDIAMFGRMTTSEAFEDVAASVQVAHALSTNALMQEFDYYTAVDDLSGESGAGMIGDIEFNSSTYYKYLNVHWEQLVENLGDDVAVARQAVLALIEAAATAQPSGKQNSFAAHSLPDLVLIEVRDKNLPVSYANAFLKPARPSGDQSLMDASVGKLADYVARVTKTFGLAGPRALIAVQEYALPGAEALPSLPELCQWLSAQLPEA